MKRRARQQQIAALTGITVVVGAIIVGLVHLAIATQIEYQQGRNKYLTEQVAILDKQIAEIQKLKEQIQSLLARKQVVETLQGNRAEVVHLIDQLVRLLPDGVYLKTIKQTGQAVALTGYAQSNARVSTLMRNLESSPWLEAATLVEIRAATVMGNQLSEFGLNLKLTRKAAEVPGKTAAAPAAAKPASGALAPASAPALTAPAPATAADKPKS